MNDYEVVHRQVVIAGRSWNLETLKDRQQFHDPSGGYEAAGIPPAAWAHFGVIWPAGIMLAEHMAKYEVEGLRILEVGCGLALASMVIHSRSGDVTASDIHPLAGEFLERNAARNNLSTVPFKVMDLAAGDEHEGTYDLVIGSDLLYERGQPEQLAAFVESHCKEQGRMILTDPGRGQVGRFNRRMRRNGFSVNEHFEGKCRLVSYARSTSSHQEASSTT